MGLPTRTEKFDSEPVVTPADSVAYHGTGDPAPAGVVVCYDDALLEHVIEQYPGTTSTDGFGTLHTLAETDGDVGVLGGFGVGAPATAIALEECLATGTTAVCSVGYAGCLDEAVGMGEFVVPDRALRDEGTSHHYLEPARWVEPPGDLTAELRAHVQASATPLHHGPTWTTDAVYRETADEVRAYADAGVLTVEMEAAAVFAVAAHRDATAAAMFVVSDYLGPDDWEPRFHRTDEDMRRLMDAAVDALDGYLGGRAQSI